MSNTQAGLLRRVCFVLLVVACLSGCKRTDRNSAAKPNNTQKAMTVTHISDNRVVLEILTEEKTMLSLYVDTTKWGSGPVGNGKKTLATLEVSNQIKLEDGSMGHGMIYTRSTEGVSGKQFLAITKNGDLPYGKVTIRNADNINETPESVTCADIVKSDGSQVPISFRLE
jgi:hypothetical protein